MGVITCQPARNRSQYLGVITTVRVVAAATHSNFTEPHEGMGGSATDLPRDRNECIASCDGSNGMSVVLWLCGKAGRARRATCVEPRPAILNGSLSLNKEKC